MMCISAKVRIVLLSMVLAFSFANAEIISKVDELVSVTVTVYADEEKTPAINSWYVLMDAADLELYNPETMEFISVGDTLSTDSFGKSTLLLTSREGADSVYVKVQSPMGTENRFGPLTFWKPRLRFIDTLGKEVTPQNIDSYTGVWNALKVEAVDLNGDRCLSCDEMLFVKDADSALVFSGNALDTVNQIQMTDGFASMWFAGIAEFDSAYFRLEGMYDGNSNPRMELNYGAPIHFTFPPVPLLRSAEIFDQSGNGTADSLVIHFAESLEGVIPDSIQINWPTGEDWTLLSNAIMIDDTTLALTGNFGESADSAKGNIRVVQTSETGLKIPQESSINDRIGPRILKTFLRKGFGSGADSLYVRFSEELDNSFAGGQAFRSDGGSIQAGKPRVHGVWMVFPVQENLLSGEDSISLEEHGGIRDVEGNEPSPRNSPAVIEELSVLPPFDDSGCAFIDEDNDGIMDQISLQFLYPITEQMISNLQISFSWPNHLDEYEDHSPNSNLLTLSDDSYGLNFVVPNTLDIQKGKTSLDSATVLKVFTVYAIEEELVQQIRTAPMQDKMAPVILDAKMQTVQRDESSPDTLTLRFSEALDLRYTDDSELLEYFVGGKIVNSEHSSPSWDESENSLTLFVAAGMDLRQRPAPGDSVRPAVIPNALRDEFGNGPVEETPRTFIMGSPRLVIAEIPYQNISGQSLEAKPFEIRMLPLETDQKMLKEQGHMGHLLDMGMVPFFKDQLAMDTMGYSLNDIQLHFKVGYYTNTGRLVLQRKGYIACDDEGFNGNCFENRRGIFLQWNYQAENGRFVGTGAYVVQLEVAVETPEKTYKAKSVGTWGVLRSRDISSFGNGR